MLGRLCRAAMFLMLCTPAWATSYFISPSGSDSNNGLSSGAPWLTPNHALNCGDTISAASGTYASTNFAAADWGTVTCPASNNVAWLICATFDACKISATSGYQGMWISKSYWGVEGWEITATGTYGTCFFISPPDSGGAEITHIVVANNVANGCDNYGIASNYVTGQSISPDYVAIIGNIIYNAARLGTAGCASGISILEPYQADAVAGTHILIDGNFSYSNLDPNPCDGTTPTDGEGIILDGLGVHSYAQQVAVLNNMVMFNGSEGILNGGVGSSTLAPVFIDHNTSYSNVEDPNDTCCNFDVGEISFTQGTASITGKFGEASYNLVALPPTAPPGAGTNTYGLSIVYGDGTSSADFNWAYGGPSGKNTVVFSSTGFSYGSHNVLGANPNFANPVAPGAPSCGSATSTVNCMATVIANFTPSASGSTAYGYQIPSSTSVTNALFPQWLCAGTGVMNVNIPAALVTPGCGVSGAAVGITGNLSVSGNVVIQ